MNPDEMRSLSLESLQSELEKAESELEDIEELSRAILGGTGVHVGARLVQRARHLYVDKGGEIRDRIGQLRRLLEERSRQEGKARQLS